MTQDPHQDDLPPELREDPADARPSAEAPRRGRRVGPMVAMTLALLLAAGGVFALPFNVGGTWTQPQQGGEQVIRAAIRSDPARVCAGGIDAGSLTHLEDLPGGSELFAARTDSGEVCALVTDANGWGSISGGSPVTGSSLLSGTDGKDRYIVLRVGLPSTGSSGFRYDYRIVDDPAEVDEWMHGGGPTDAEHV